MDKQTIQELEIIVRAQVENARKDLRKVAQETKGMVSSISKDLDTLNKDGSLDGFKESIKDGVEELRELEEEMRKIKVTDGPISFEFKADGSDFKEQMEKAYAEYEKMHPQVEYDPPDVEETNSSINIDSGQSVQEIKKIEDEVYTLKERLKEFDFLTLREQIKTVAMQFNELVPQVGQFANAVKDRFNDTTSIFGLMKQKIQELIPVISNMANNISNKFGEIKNKIVSPFSNAKQAISAKLAPVGSLLTNIGKVGKNAFQQLAINIKESANTTGTPLNKITQLIKKIKDVKTNSDKVKKGMNGFGTSIGKSFSNGIKSIKKFALSLLSVRTAFSAISRASQAYLSYDTQLQSSLQNSWNVLGSLLAPILEYVAGLFSKLVNSVASFVKALTGIDLVARANAKALNSQAKASANANKQLSGIDDIDTLSSGSGGGSNDTPTINVEDVDTGPLVNAFNKVKEVLSVIFEPLKKAWDKVGPGLITSIKNMFSEIGELASSVFGSFSEVWSNGTGELIFTNMLTGWQQVIDIIAIVTDALTNAWNNAGTGTAIIQSICNIFSTIQSFVLSIGNTIKQWVLSDGFQSALNVILTLIKDIFGIVENVAKWVLNMYDEYLKPVIEEKLLPAISAVIVAIGDVWNAVKPVVNFIIEIIKTALEPVIKGLCDFIGGIIDIVKGIADFISGVFTGDWKKAWNGIKTIFKGIWDSLKSIIATPINGILAGVECLVNAIIKGFNLLKKSINKISFDVPDWVPGIGGQKWGFNLKMSEEVKLPRLASGTVASEPIVAEIGEYANAKSDPEIVSPISMMKDSFRSVLNEFDFGGTRFDTLKIDVAGKNFYDDAIDYINEKSERNGVSVIKEV